MAMYLVSFDTFAYLVADLTHVHDFLGIIVPGGNSSYVETVTHDRRVSVKRDLLVSKETYCIRGDGYTRPAGERNHVPIKRDLLIIKRDLLTLCAYKVSARQESHMSVKRDLLVSKEAY